MEENQSLTMDQQMNNVSSQRQVLKRTQKDETDQKIDKLRGINGKLMNKMKELNTVLEKTLEKANNKKIAKMNKEVHAAKVDPRHQLLVKQGELKNSRNQVEKHQKDIADMSQKLNNV